MNIPDLLKDVIKNIKYRRMLYNALVFLAIAQGIPMVKEWLSVVYNANVFGVAGAMIISIAGLYSALLIVNKKV